jgi:ATP-dependent DNA helicase RecQ
MSPKDKNPTIYEQLKTVFGFEAFRPNQEPIINKILNKQDVFAVMPTGGGKSLCYQLPAKMMHGTTLVISPLISLMKDQVDAAKENGIAATFMNSTLTAKEMSAAHQKLRSNEIELLYIAPERFVMPNFLETLKNIDISFFAIDEAHCISEWGHDFRSDYLSLSLIIKMFPAAAVAAFTATATLKVQDDIIRKIGLRSPHIIRASFNRPNLFYRVERKASVNLQILEFLKEHPNEAGIIYRTTRKSVEETADFLVSNGIGALPYHAGLSPEERSGNQETFNHDDAPVMVATIAFGMGIDKSNVRFVVHADLPKNIEGYYQETGRAGRDGVLADCLLFYSNSDIPKIRYFINQIPGDNERSAAMENLRRMVKFASHNSCRRKQLLKFFDEEYTADNCSSCDICTETTKEVDITLDAQMLMSAIYRTGQNFGIRHIVDVVTGANTKRIRSLRHNKIKTYGSGKDKKKKFWVSLSDELLAQDVIWQSGDKYPVIKLTPKGSDLLFGKTQLTVLRKESSKVSAKRDALEYYDDVLFGRLRAVRKKLAKEQHVPPFVIFSDRTLHEMCRHYPVSESDMRKISGVGEVKIQRYAVAFIDEIKQYLDENPDIRVKGAQFTDVNYESKPRRKKKIGESVEVTYALFQEGLSIQDIAKKRGFATTTIAGHFEMLIQNGRDIDIDRLIDPAKRAEIEKLFLALKQLNLKPVVERSNGTISYDEARIARAFLINLKSAF